MPARPPRPPKQPPARPYGYRERPAAAAPGGARPMLDVDLSRASDSALPPSLIATALDPATSTDVESRGNNLAPYDAGATKAAGTWDVPLDVAGVQAGEFLSAAAEMQPTGVGVVEIALQYLDAFGAVLETFSGEQLAGAAYKRIRIEGAKVPAAAKIARLMAVVVGGVGSYNARFAMISRGKQALPYEEPPFRPSRGGSGDNLDAIADGTLYGRTVANYLSGGKVARVLRAGTDEIPDNLFKRGVNTLSDVLDDTTYNRVLTTAVTSGQIDLAKAGVISKYLANLQRSGANATTLATIAQNLADSGHLAALMQDSTGREARRAYAKASFTDSDNADYVIDGSGRRVPLLAHLNSAGVLLSSVDGGASIDGSSAGELSKRRGAMFVETFDVLPSAATGWAVSIGGGGGIALQSDTNSTMGRNVLGCTGFIQLLGTRFIPINPNKLYRFRCRVRTVAYNTGTGGAANSTFYIGVLQTDYAGNPTNANSGAGYVVASSYDPAAEVGFAAFKEYVGWVKGANIIFASAPAISTDAFAPVAFNAGTVHIRPYLLIGYPAAGGTASGGGFMVDYYLIDEYDEDGTMRTYSALDSYNGSYGRTLPTTRDSALREVRRALAKSTFTDPDTLDGVSEGTSYQRVLATAVTSGQIDLAKAGVVNRTLANLQRSGADPTTLATIASQIANSGHLASTMQDATAREVRRAYAKANFTDGDTLDYVVDGASYGRSSYTRLGYSDRAGSGLDTSGDLARDIVTTRRLAGASRLLAHQLSPDSYIPNADFDVWDSASAPTSWIVDGANGATCVKDTATKYSGASALAYSNPDNSSNSGWHGIASGFTVPLRPGQRYRLRVATRTSLAGSTYRFVLYYNVAGSVIDVVTVNYTAANAWQVDEWVFTVPTNAEPLSQLFVQFNRNGSATPANFWVDSLRLEEAAPSANEIVGGARGFGGFTDATGSLISTSQDSTGRAVRRAFAKPTYTDPDTLDGVSEGTTYKRVLGVNGSNLITPTSSAGRSRCRATISTVQSIAHNTGIAVLFGAEDYDVGGLHSTATNTSRITIPAGGNTGCWLFTAWIVFDFNAAGDRKVAISKNSGTELAGLIQRATAGIVPWVMVHLIEDAPAAGDFYEISVLQTSGGALNITNGWFSAVHLW
jgi:hypothetical protein